MRIVSQKGAQSTEWQGEAKLRKIIQNVIKTCEDIPPWVKLKCNPNDSSEKILYY